MPENICATCGKTFESSSKFTQHSTKTHDEKKCDECGNMFQKANSIVTTSSFNPVVSIKTMFHFVATMSFQEFHFPFHNDRRSWRQHFLSMNRGGKADWYNVDLPFLLQGLGPSFCSIPQYWPLKILLIFVFQYGDFGGSVSHDATFGYYQNFPMKINMWLS